MCHMMLRFDSRCRDGREQDGYGTPSCASFLHLPGKIPDALGKQHQTTLDDSHKGRRGVHDTTPLEKFKSLDQLRTWFP